MHKNIFVLILIDQVTKLIFWSRDFSFGPLHIHSVKNFGLVFSLNFGPLYNLLLIFGALVFFIFYYWHHQVSFSWFSKIMFALIISGAISNIIDRLYIGYVRDFLDFGFGLTFNFADLMVLLGILGLILDQNKQDYADEF